MGVSGRALQLRGGAVTRGSYRCHHLPQRHPSRGAWTEDRPTQGLQPWRPRRSPKPPGHDPCSNCCAQRGSRAQCIRAYDTAAPGRSGGRRHSHVGHDHDPGPTPDHEFWGYSLRRSSRDWTSRVNRRRSWRSCSDGCHHGDEFTLAGDGGPDKRTLHSLWRAQGLQRDQSRGGRDAECRAGVRRRRAGGGRGGWHEQARCGGAQARRAAHSCQHCGVAAASHWHCPCCCHCTPYCWYISCSASSRYQ
mmetsp:Transcript_10657/g.17373  ORF Transcript_10657/g.17373 Transcript_10657/m.17373 type:complete len:248 (+) Transcript_10657:1453-2196(+)